MAAPAQHDFHMRYISLPAPQPVPLTRPLFWKGQGGLGLDSLQGTMSLGPGLSLHSCPCANSGALVEPTSPLRHLGGTVFPTLAPF